MVLVRPDSRNLVFSLKAGSVSLLSRVHTKGVTCLLRRVLRRVLETAFEKVLRRFLRRCLLVGFKGRKGSENGS